MTLLSTTRRHVAPLSVGFAAGLLMGAAIVAWFGARALLSSQIDTDTAVAALASDALASLRTSDPATAERRLEQAIDSGVQSASYQSSAFPWYRGLTARQSHQLAEVKFYRSAFRSTQPGNVDVSPLLANIPDMQIKPDPDCASGYCRIARSRSASVLPVSKD